MSEHPTADKSTDEIITQLMQFYSVTTLKGLAIAQAKHVERLQEKLPKTPDPFRVQRVREG